MLDEKHVIVNINQLAESAEGLKDEDTLRYMEEHLCPFDHTFMMQKPPRQESSLILGPNGQPQIEVGIVAFNAFVEEVTQITLPGKFLPTDAQPNLYKNIYKCNICGSYYIGDWYYKKEDNSSGDTIISIVYPSDEEIKEYIQKYESITGEKFCEEKAIEEVFRTKLLPYGKAFLNYKNKGQK